MLSSQKRDSGRDRGPTEQEHEKHGHPEASLSRKLKIAVMGQLSPADDGIFRIRYRKRPRSGAEDRVGPSHSESPLPGVDPEAARVRLSLYGGHTARQRLPRPCEGQNARDSQ